MANTSKQQHYEQIKISLIFSSSDESNDVEAKDEIDSDANESQDEGDEATDTAVDEDAADSEDPGKK